jgi:hypothetical protein
MLQRSPTVPTFDNDLLIDRATGEVRHDHIRSTARARAEARYGADCRESDVAEKIEALTAIAQILRKRRRDELGLPDDTAYVTVTPFGRQVEGVRRSAF